MFKKIILPLICILSFTSLAFSEVKLPEGTIQAGSLCNQKLIMDAKVGVAGKVATLGCDKPETLQMFVVKLPTGKVGSKNWQEKWMVGGCKKK